MITVIETAQFIKKSKQIMTQAEKDHLIETIARNPKTGEIIPKTGGVRKLRIARAGQGKSGSFRSIHYYFDNKNPVFLFTVFGKNEKANLTEAEKNALYKIVQQIKKEMKT